MINAVIYARYSSHAQTEQSIEGQLHDAYEYAERNGYKIVGEYIDRALTGTKDTRPDFQRMIRDAATHAFAVVLVWKLDRFARNRYDSAVYKSQLKKHGVRVVSVMESITDSPEGIILEGLLEAMAEYYSANLAENVRRGQRESADKGWFVGGQIALGYQLQDHRLVADERTAPIIREAFRRYADGEAVSVIARDLNRRGYRTARGLPFKANSFDAILTNPLYIGEPVYGGRTIAGMSDALIDRATFDRAVARRAANRRAPAARQGDAVYALQGKLFCGLCGKPMAGDCGRSRTGAYYHYYTCSARKNKTGPCRKKSERQDALEPYICRLAVDYILDPARVQTISEAVARIYQDDTSDTRLADLERTVRRLEADVATLVDSLITCPPSARARIGERIAELEAQRVDAETDLSKLRLSARIQITEKEVAAWLSTFQDSDLTDPGDRSRIIDTFINSIYLYEDKLVIFFNVRAGELSAPPAPDAVSDTIENPATSVSRLAGESGVNPGKLEPGRPYLIVVHRVPGVVIFR